MNGFIVAMTVGLPLVCAILGAIGWLKPRATVIGIDLGTTFSVVAYTKDHNITVVTNPEGSVLTPSTIALLPNGSFLVGESARTYARSYPEASVSSAKRFIGRSWGDVSASKEVKDHSFQIGADDKTCHQPFATECPTAGFLFEVRSGNHRKELRPQDVGAIIVKQLKDNAMQALGHSQVHAAVIAVPAKFSKEQRKATEEAFTQAGLKVARVLEEPTAAAVAYGLHQSPHVHHVLVYDFGGGTLDVSILYMSEGAATVIGTAGDDYLGGEDFDHCLMEHLLGGTQGQSQNSNLSPEHLERFAQSVEALKRRMSDSAPATPHTVTLPGGGQATVTRSDFEQACDALFQRGLLPVHIALQSSGLVAQELDAVVLVGGSTRMPKIQELLESIVSRDKIHNDIDPDIAVAVGAARIVD